jgi:hypothetical protein
MQTRCGKKYFIIFSMIAQDIMYVYLLKSKDKALEMDKHFKNKAEIHLSMRIKMIRQD